MKQVLAIKQKRSNTKKYSCASCHRSAASFQNSMQQGIGDVGMGFGLKGETRVMATNYTIKMLDL